MKMTTLLRAVIAMMTVGLSACEDATTEMRQSSATISTRLKAMARSGSSNGSAFLRPAKLTIIEDRISLLDKDLDRTLVHEYFPAACESASRHCLYNIGYDGEPMLSSPMYDFPYTRDSSGVPVFQYNTCKDWRGNGKVCDPVVNFIQLYENGLGHGATGSMVSVFTWYQNAAQARRAASLRATVIPQLLGDRVTKEEIQRRNQEVMGVAGSILQGAIEGTVQARSISTDGSSTAGTVRSSGGTCPEADEGVDKVAYNAMLDRMGITPACRLSTCGPDRVCAEQGSGSIR